MQPSGTRELRAFHGLKYWPQANKIRDLVVNIKRNLCDILQVGKYVTHKIPPLLRAKELAGGDCRVLRPWVCNWELRMPRIWHLVIRWKRTYTQTPAVDSHTCDHRIELHPWPCKFDRRSITYCHLQLPQQIQPQSTAKVLNCLSVLFSTLWCFQHSRCFFGGLQSITGSARYRSVCIAWLLKALPTLKLRIEEPN